MKDVFVIDSCRTWIGKFRGGLSGARPDDLAASVLRSLTDRNLGISHNLEAFAAQVLAGLREMPALDPAIVNPQGGAIAIGHPLDATGARVVGTLARQLAAAGGGVGLATACIGVGQGLAVVLEA